LSRKAIRLRSYPQGRSRRGRMVLHNPRKLEKEVTGVLFLALSTFLFLALLSYNSSDPSWNTTGALTPEKIHNYTGVLGAYIADFLLQGFGLSSIFLPVGLFSLGLTFLFYPGFIIRWPRIVGVGFMTLFAAALLSLIAKKFTFLGQPYPSGGFLGDLLSAGILRFGNHIGTYILLGTAFVTTFIYVTGLSVSYLLQGALKGLVLLNQFLFWSLRNLWVLGGLIWEKIQDFKSKEDSEETREHRSTAELVDASDEELHMGPCEWNAEAAAFHLEESKSNLEKDDDKEGEEEGPIIVTRPQREPGKKEPKIQEKLSFKNVDKDYQLPQVELLDMDLEKPQPVDEWSLRMNSKILEKKLMDYGVEGKVVEIHPGPVITMYEFQPAPGVKVHKIVNLCDDLSLSMGGRAVRIIAPIPGKPVIGIEIPNHHRETVALYELINHHSFINDIGLTLALGKDSEGESVVTNLAKMPHLLIAGATGTGKSVAIHAMICSLLMKFTPDKIRFLLMDPKMVELPVYQGIPHLLLPVITEAKKTGVALKWAVNEMEQRLRLLSNAGTRNIESYNKKISKRKAQKIKDKESEDPTILHESKVISNLDGKLPYIVIVIDELADLMVIAGRDFEESITRLAQMARAVGIHLIVATQRPSVDVITGLIKANFPARISFKVSTRIDSRTILDCMGAESLLGDGDMLFMHPGNTEIRRIHGGFVTEQEVGRIVDFLREQGNPEYEESILESQESALDIEREEEVDEFFDKAVDIVTTSGQASISYLQRRLRIGYNRAARIIEMMEKNGIIGPQEGFKPREIFISRMDSHSPPKTL